MLMQNWSDAENHAMIEDYFVVLADGIAWRPCSGG